MDLTNLEIGLILMEGSILLSFLKTKDKPGLGEKSKRGRQGARLARRFGPVPGIASGDGAPLPGALQKSGGEEGDYQSAHRNAGYEDDISGKPYPPGKRKREERPDSGSRGGKSRTDPGNGPFRLRSL
jgi:hypothetical protein